MNDIQVGRGLTIPGAELSLRFTTSGGPGGQHANRSSTKVVLSWNVEESAVLSSRQRALIKQRLRHRISTSGEISVSVDEHRSQLMNRREAERRLAGLLTVALTPKRTRRPTKPTKSAVDRRIADKKRRGELKRSRRQDFSDG